MEDYRLQQQEYDENNPTRKRPRLLMVLIILSSINIFFSLIGTTTTISRGPVTQKAIDAEFNPIKKQIDKLSDGSNNEKLEATLNGMITRTKQNTEYKNFNVFYLFNWLLFLTFIIGIISLYFLFSLRKIGLHLYIIYSLLPILIAYAILPVHLVLPYQVIFTVILAALFSILYGLNLKFMH